MSDEHKQYAATSAVTLEAHILSVHSAKSDAEWWAQREIERLRAENEKLRAALKPFADVAENDIGDDETDADIFRPITGRYNHAPLLTVGDLRTAAAALKETGK